jgi:hypothetical protein
MTTITQMQEATALMTTQVKELIAQKDQTGVPEKMTILANYYLALKKEFDLKVLADAKLLK